MASQHAENARAFGEHLKGITEQYQISYIELDRDLELDKVCDIFTQINSRGIRLDVFDLINALLKPKGLQLKHLWRDAAPELDFVETERMNVYILQVMSILRQAYCSPKYLYYLLPGQEKKVREPDGSLAQGGAGSEHRRVRETVASRRSMLSIGRSICSDILRSSAPSRLSICLTFRSFRPLRPFRPRLGHCLPIASSMLSASFGTGTGPAYSPTAIQAQSSPRARGTFST